jgi:hypothetical protein
MNPSQSQQTESSKLGWPVIVQAVMAYAVPTLAFVLDYRYFGPIVRFGPFIVWTAAALGMGAFAAVGRAREYPFLGGVLSAFLLGGALLSVGIALVTLPIVLIAKSFTLSLVGGGLLGTALFYGRRWLAARRGSPRTYGSMAGAAIGLALFVLLPLLAQTLHDRHFAGRLADLEAADPAVRERELKSLIGSRFCWSSCTRAVCEARAGLDAATVKDVLATSDVDLACDAPDSGEWPG